MTKQNEEMPVSRRSAKVCVVGSAAPLDALRISLEERLETFELTLVSNPAGLIGGFMKANQVDVVLMIPEGPQDLDRVLEADPTVQVIALADLDDDAYRSWRNGRATLLMDWRARVLAHFVELAVERAHLMRGELETAGPLGTVLLANSKSLSRSPGKSFARNEESERSWKSTCEGPRGSRR